MVRGVVVVVTVFFAVAVVTFVGGAAIEPVGEHIKTYDEIDENGLSGTSVINDVYQSVFVWAPLIVMGGISLVGLVFYLRRERVPRGGGRL